MIVSEFEMSVWPTSVTRIGTAKDVYESSKELFKATYGKTVYPHLDPVSGYTDITRETEWEELAEDMDWEEPEEEDGELLLNDISGLGHVAVGAEGYYVLISAIFKGHLVFPKVYDRIETERLAKSCLEVVMPSSQVTPARFMEKALARDEGLDTVLQSFIDASEGLKMLKRARAWDDQDDEYDNSLADKVAAKSLYVFRKVGKVFVFFGIGPYGNRAVVLSRKGMDMVIGALERLSALVSYTVRAYASDSMQVMRVQDIITSQIIRAGQLRGSAADKVAKAWHEVRTYVQYKILDSIMTDAVEAIEKEFIIDGFNDIVDLADASALVTAPEIADTLELVHVYKWMPPPEYDVTRALPLVADLHKAPRESGAGPMANETARELYEKIKAERKMNLLTAYKKMAGDYPADLVIRGAKPTIEEASAWDHTDLFAYEQLGSDISKQVKDKTTVKASMEAEIKSSGGDLDQNYLTWFMTEWESADTDKWLTELSSGVLDEDAYCRVAYKGESQKVDSRPFFIAPPKRRTLLAEHEGNLSKIAKFYPAVLIGKNEATVGAMMDEAMDPYSAENTTSEVTTTYIVMFDASKWSPKSDGAQVAEYHNFWAEVYGDPRLKSLASIGCDDTLISTTDDVLIKYQNGGADLEGFRGRMGTMYHADMLGAVCRESIKKKYIAGKSSLVVFIDDGAVKIEARGTGATARRNARNFLETLKAVYAAGGQEIHDRKVVISPIGGEILANFYVHGVLAPQGIKAAMKMTPDYSNPIATLGELNDSLFASAQGAVKSGADPFATYALYIEGIIQNVFRIKRRLKYEINPTTFALMTYLPKSFGGLGAQSVQGLVTTCVTNLTAECMSILNRAGRYYPSLREPIKKLVQRSILKREPLSILRDPMRVSASGPVLVESRLVRSVIKRLTESHDELSEFVEGEHVEKIREHAKAVAEKLLAGPSISVPLMMRAWSATPLAELEALVGKFERSDSIIRTLGYKTIGTIRRANIRDVDNIYENGMSLTGNI